MRYVVPSYRDCQRCGLCQYRRHVVFGRGRVPADVLFIGEAPGKAEDLLGEAFVGPAGRVLQDSLQEASRLSGLPVPSHFITNVCACRPTDAPQGPNREPTEMEAWQCRERLVQTHHDVHPSRVVLLGRVAERECRRIWPGCVVIPHPAWLLRSGGTSSGAFLTYARALSAVFLVLKGR
jgi:uracil-DNA glycosylase family 4